MVIFSPRHTAPAVMSWTIARRLAVLVAITRLLLLPAIHAAAIKQDATTQYETSAGNDFDNSITAFTDVKSIESSDDESGFEIRCYCNMPACLAASGGVRTCTTRLGCFSQLQPNLPNLDGTVTHPVTTTTTTRMTTLIPEEFDVEAAIYGNDNALNGAYGCLDVLPINKTCDEVLKLMENEQSEFPFIMGTQSESNNNVMSAYHCCEEDMCNDRSHIAASAPKAEASLIAAFKNSMNIIKDIKNTATTTEKLPYLPVPVALVNGRKEFFVEVGNIAPNVFPKKIDSSVNTSTIDTSSSESKYITLFSEFAKNMRLTNNITTPVVNDNNFSMDGSSKSTESSLVSNTNYITSNETTALSYINVTSIEATSTLIDTKVTSTETNPMVNTTSTADIVTIENISSGLMDVDFEKNSTITSTEFISNENNSTIATTNINSYDNNTFPLFAEVDHKVINVTSPIIDINIETTTASGIQSTLTSNTSEVFVSDSNSTMPISFIITNATEVTTAIPETEQKKEFNSGKLSHVIIRRFDFPRALAFHKSSEEENTSIATPLEAVLNSTESPDNFKLFFAHEKTSEDSSYNRQRSVDEAHHQSSSGLLGWTGIPQWVEGVTGILAICGVIGVTIVALVAMKIVRKTDVFEQYKSVCSNPGQPCACNGGLGSRRSRQLTSSSTVYRNTTTSIQPVLPPPNNSLYGLTYVDSTGNSTHVYTPIPVPP